jgi:hypothetical protein
MYVHHAAPTSNQRIEQRPPGTGPGTFNSRIMESGLMPTKFDEAVEKK